MSDLQNMADLVSTGNQLLDDIRGGAISRMAHEHQTQQAEFKSEHDAKSAQFQAEHNAKLSAADSAVSELNSRVGDVIGQMPFTAINGNHDFRNVTTFTSSGGIEHRIPVGLGINSPDSIKMSVIPVTNGSTPESRDPEAIELLNFITGSNPKYFSGSFNILKVEVVDAESLKAAPYGFHIPNQHIKTTPKATFMAYYKLISGSAGQVSWLGSSQSWSRARHVIENTNPLNYTHVDIIFHDNVQNGDVLYIALPTIVVGNFPDVNYGVLYSNHAQIN